ncbi:MAG: amino acid permease [Bacteroidota bacterium]|nr:amino acid permease [Bacteroidota bacterium]
MDTQAGGRGHGFGTLPVFLAGISTILGAIMFLRFGYAVGNVGLLGVLAIIFLGHLVTIPTALALAEIATNRKVEGGGEYFIISRSFGTTIGGVIGLCLYLSQAVSVAFYLIAFAEAFRPLEAAFASTFGFNFDPRFVSLPALVALLVPVIYKGAAIGVKILYVVASVLLLSLISFFLGTPVEGFDPDTVSLTATASNPDTFFIVFAIVFPAFTGMTAGVGLSGDLRNPRKSIPSGTIWATLTGMVVYVFIVVKLAWSAPAEALASDQLIMRQIARWGFMILIGLGCATLSSAIGSALVAPRTLQALAGDGVFPGAQSNRWLARGVGNANDPRNATLVTGAIALVIVYLGDVDFVARLISMFFMVTYGALCAISFLEHFAARPSYRPSFRSRWYLSLLGAIMCLLMMFQMDPVFAMLAIVVLGGLYQALKRGGEGDLADMFQGVMNQATRYMSVRLQRRREETDYREWRPSIIMVNDRTFDRRSPLTMLRWLCHRFGFGTYLHFIQGRLDQEHYAESQEMKSRLLELAKSQKSTIYMDTVVSPSMISALAQSLQVPGVSGMSNNGILFEFSDHDSPAIVRDVVQYARFAANTNTTLLVLRHGDYHFGERLSIHIWLTWNDQDNANMMILLSYIILGHPDWKRASVRVFAALPQEAMVQMHKDFSRLIEDGRLPISEKNIEYIPMEDVEVFRAEVRERSQGADLTVIGFSVEGLQKRASEVFTNHGDLKDVLFVHTPRRITIE